MRNEVYNQSPLDEKTNKVWIPYYEIFFHFMSIIKYLAFIAAKVAHRDLKDFIIKIFELQFRKGM